MNSFDLMIERYSRELINAKRRSILQAIDDADRETEREETAPADPIVDESNFEPRDLMPEPENEPPRQQPEKPQKPRPPLPEATGTLKVQVFAADRVYPVSAAKVTVSDYESGRELFTGYTDVDGIAQSITLPAPNPELSETPAREKPYSQYNITVEHSRFFPRKFIGVPVFAGITSVQNVQLVPTEGGMTNEPDIDKREHNDGLTAHTDGAQKEWEKWQTP